MVAVGCKRAALNQEIEMLHSQIHQQLPMKNAVFVLVILPRLKNVRDYHAPATRCSTTAPKATSDASAARAMDAHGGERARSAAFTKADLVPCLGLIAWVCSGVHSTQCLNHNLRAL